MSRATELREAATAFCREGRSCPIELLGDGNINDTFVVRSPAGSFVLQRINSGVFPEPLRVIHNFEKITRYLIGKKLESGVGFRVARSIRTLDDELFFRDFKGKFWRAQTFLEGTAHTTLTGLEQVRRAGRTLALFHQLSTDLDVAILEDPLPGFHDLPGYLAEYDRVRQVNSIISDRDGEFCLEAIERLRPRSIFLEDARKGGVLVVQPIHGDPKIDNFIFSVPGEPDGMLDFDTVGGGLVHYDLGDCLRSCCNRAGESGARTFPVSFDLQYCQGFLGGYFSVMPDFLGKEQRQYIFDSILLLTFELGLRFFTDHLRGNTYFKVAEDGLNLTRAIRQFRLVDDIVRKEKEIRLLTG